MSKRDPLEYAVPVFVSPASPGVVNAFVGGYTGKPHGYVRSSPVKKSPPPRPRYQRGGFGSNTGTIPGMREAKCSRELSASNDDK